jgi:hypothetical protein
MLHAHLLANDRDVKAQLVEDADHSFRIERDDGEIVDAWSAVMRDILDWYLDPQAP